MPDDVDERSDSEFGTEAHTEAETHELEGPFPAFAETDLKPRKHP